MKAEFKIFQLPFEIHALCLLIFIRFVFSLQTEACYFKTCWAIWYSFLKKKNNCMSCLPFPSEIFKKELLHRNIFISFREQKVSLVVICGEVWQHPLVSTLTGLLLPPHKARVLQSPHTPTEDSHGAAGWRGVCLANVSKDLPETTDPAEKRTYFHFPSCDYGWL